MTNQTQQDVWTIYLDAWADVTPDERKKLLGASVAEDCVFTSPTADGRGMMELIAYIEGFQKLYPGASFKTHKFLEQHGRSLAEWIMYDKDGAEFLPGKSFGRFGPDGRLTELAGFWEL